ncbi:MAG TPA: DUF3102 domain-containing protein [Candidatus Gemmiger faecavium]|nr:DUF3102 domain-containing protein [Candidatus Gemmiger faecavium]
MEQMIEFTGGTAAQQMQAASLHAEIRQKKEVLGNALADFCEALKRMRDGKLYQVLGYQDFGTYCEEQHGIRARMAYKYIKAYEDLGRQLMEQNASAGITKLALLGEVCAPDRAEFAADHDLAGMTVQEIKAAIKAAADLGEQVSLLQEENARITHEAELDRKEQEDANAAAMRYKDECDRRAQDQQRVEGLLKTREARLAELEDTVRAQREQLKAQQVETSAIDTEEMHRQADRLAAEMVAAAEKAWKAEAEKQKQEAADAAAQRVQADMNMELAAARTEAENARAQAEKNIRQAVEEALQKERAASAQMQQEMEEKARQLEKRLQVAGDKTTMRFALLFEQAQRNINEAVETLEKVRAAGDGETADKLKAAMRQMLEAAGQLVQEV